MGVSFTKQEIERAKSVDLLEIARELGYTVKSVGKYHTLKEMDSIRIHDSRTWYRWSDNTGGSQIDFLMTFADMDFGEAVSFLLNRSGYLRFVHPEVKEKKPFKLPERSVDDHRMVAYLMRERSLKPETIDHFKSAGLIYEEKDHHNIVFVGRDKDGTPRFGNMRGTYDKDCAAFKCDVTGSDKNYGFHLEADGSDSVRVFEGAIDLMSFYDATRLTSDHLLALGMVNDKPLSRYLADHPEIKKIFLCLDNDEPGQKAADVIQEKYAGRGYWVRNLGSPKGYKDFNEWLVTTRSRERLSQPEKVYRHAR